MKFFSRFYIQRSARLQLRRRSRGPGEVRVLLQLAEFRHRTNLQLGVLVRRRKKVTFLFCEQLTCSQHVLGHRARSLQPARVRAPGETTHLFPNLKKGFF